MSQSFEDEFREIAGNHEEKVNFDALWANVETAIVKDKKKKGGFLIFLCIGALTALSLTTYYWNDDTVENTEQVASAINPEGINELRLAKVILDKPVEKNIEYEVREQDESTSENLIKKEGIDKIGQDVISKSGPIENTISSVVDPVPLSQEVTEMNLEKETIILEAKNKVAGSNYTENLRDSKVKNQVSGIIGIRAEQRISILDKLQSHGIDYKSDNLGLIASKKIRKPVRKQANKSLRLTSGISFGNQNYQGNITDDFYRTMERYDISLEAQLKSIGNWSLWLGINYGQFTDEFSWNGQYIINKDEDYVSDRIYLVGMQVQDVYSNGLDYLIDQNVLKYTSRTVLSIPIKLQYAQNINTWAMELYGSVQVNYQLGSEYYFIDNKGAPQIEKTSNQFTQPSFVLGSNIGYKISPDKMIISGLYFQGMKHGFENDIEKQIFKDSRIGVSLGFQYQY